MKSSELGKTYFKKFSVGGAKHEKGSTLSTAKSK